MIPFSPQFSAVLPAFNLQRKAKPTPKFGRDALFERNDQFVNRKPAHQIGEQECHLLKHMRGQKAIQDTIRHLEQRSTDYYDVKQGRVLGKNFLKSALLLADAQSALMNQNVQAFPVERALTQIKLANACIAVPNDQCPSPAEAKQYNIRGFKLLNKALQDLEQLNYKPDPKNAPPVYVHGLYNRGTFYFNHFVYRQPLENAKHANFQHPTESHDLIKAMEIRLTQPQAKGPLELLIEALPQLKKAIIFSASLQDSGIAYAEYVLMAGEILHAMSYYSPEPSQKPNLNQRSLLAFSSAQKSLRNIPAFQLTQRHLSLSEYLNAKILHLCSALHELPAPPKDEPQLYQTLARDSQKTLSDISQKLQTPNTDNWMNWEPS